MAATVTAAEAAKRVQEERGAALLDVRTPAEYQEVHAEGAKLLPLDRFDSAQAQSVRTNGAPLFVLCRTGSRAKQACEKLAASGAENVFVVEGGTEAWAGAGLPVKRGRKIMSLERQVRIAAGSLVFIGSVLAWLVHPYILAVPAFVGAGLVFAGVTDTCGMGMLIAKMPWNQTKVDPDCLVGAACSR
jgi:rhodanese-related sulfurtransferase